MKKIIRLLFVITLIFTLGILTSCKEKKSNVLPDLYGMTRERIIEELKNVDIRYQFYFTDDIIESSLDLDQFRRYGDGLKAGDTVKSGQFVRIYTTVLPLTIDRLNEVKMDFELEENQSFIDTGKGKVKLLRTVDGDTAHFTDPYTTSADNVVKVRFLGIDTPESTYEIDPWGKEASAFTSKILRGAREIILEREGAQMDSYGRYLAYVWVDGELLNLLLVQQAYSNSTAPLSSKYGNIMMEVANEVRKTGRRFYGETDPNYDYSKGR